MIEILLGFIPSLWEFIVLLFLMFESLITAYLLNYHPLFNLPQIDALNIYPFICNRCTTFWTNLIQCILLAYIWDWHFFIWGLITASTLAYMIYYSNER